MCLINSWMYQGHVSAIVACIELMEVIEEQAIQYVITPPKTWKRYVDDNFAVMNKSAVVIFTTHSILLTLTSCNFIYRTLIERTNCLSLLSRQLYSINVYHKPTHSDRYLNFSSHHIISVGCMKSNDKWNSLSKKLDFF